MLRPSSPLYIPFSLNPRLIRFLLGFARACLPGTWRSSLAVYAEVSRIAMAAFDELTDGGVAEPTHLAEPFLAGFSSAKEREGLVQEFRLSESGGVGPDYDLVTGDEMRAIEPTLGAGVTAGVRLHGQHFINPPKFVDALADGGAFPRRQHRHRIRRDRECTTSAAPASRSSPRPATRCARMPSCWHPAPGWAPWPGASGCASWCRPAAATASRSCPR